MSLLFSIFKTRPFSPSSLSLLSFMLKHQPFSALFHLQLQIPTLLSITFFWGVFSHLQNSTILSILFISFFFLSSIKIDSCLHHHLLFISSLHFDLLSIFLISSFFLQSTKTDLLLHHHNLFFLSFIYKIRPFSTTSSSSLPQHRQITPSLLFLHHSFLPSWSTFRVQPLVSPLCNR